MATVKSKSEGYIESTNIREARILFSFGSDPNGFSGIAHGGRIDLAG